MLVLALVGLAIATYLTLYQVDVLSSPWDPIFGDGSRQVLDLTSPIPDAAAGVVAYGSESLLLGAGRGRTLLGLILVAGVGTSVVLVVVQATVVGDWCTLCLVSAAMSFALAWLGREEAVGALRRLRAARADLAGERA